MCSVAGKAQRELMRVENFRRLSAGTVDGRVDGIFPVRGVLSGSKGYINIRVYRPC